MHRTLIIVPLVAGAFLGAGCDPCAGVLCGACEPAIEVRVQDAVTGDPVDATVDTTVEATVDEQPCDHGYCQLSIYDPGTYELTIRAPGYQTRTVEVTVPATQSEGCCACGYEPTDVDVTLERT